MKSHTLSTTVVIGHLNPIIILCLLFGQQFTPPVTQLFCPVADVQSHTDRSIVNDGQTLIPHNKSRKSQSSCAKARTERKTHTYAQRRISVNIVFRWLTFPSLHDCLWKCVLVNTIENECVVEFSTQCPPEIIAKYRKGFRTSGNGAE